MEVSKECLEHYLAKHKSVSVGEILAEFLIDYLTAINMLTELANEGKVRQVGDFRFKDNGCNLHSELEYELDGELNIKAIVTQLKKSLLRKNYIYGNKEEFENYCMDIIEMIVKTSKLITRQDAIAISANLKACAQEKGGGYRDKLKIFERVEHEFQIATDKEFELLKRTIYT